MIEEYDAHITDTNEKSIAAIWKRTAANKACDAFYEHCQFEDLQGVLKYLSYEDQFNFLKVKKDCNVMLIQLYKDHNKVDLLAAYYLDMRMFYEASQLEVNISLKVKYILMAVRQLCGTNVADKKTSMLAAINIVLEELDNSSLSNEAVGLKFDLMYHKMQLEEDFTGIKDIFLHYHENKSIIMKLICFHYWIQSNPSCTSDSLPGGGSVLRCMLDFVKDVFDIIKQLLSRQTTTIVNDCFVHFGLLRDVLDEQKYVVEDETLFLYFMEFSKTKGYGVEIPKNGGSMNLSRVQAGITRIFLKLSHGFILLLYNGLISNFKHATLSLNTHGCYYEGCKVNHDLPTAGSFASGRDLIVSLFELRALFQEAYKFLKETSIQNDVNWLETVIKSDELLRYLADFIFSYIPFMHVLKERDFVDVFVNVPKSVSLELISSVRQVWKMDEEKEVTCGHQ